MNVAPLFWMFVPVVNNIKVRWGRHTQVDSVVRNLRHSREAGVVDNSMGRKGLVVGEEVQYCVLEAFVSHLCRTGMSIDLR